MNYQQFVELMKEKVAKELGEGMSLETHTTLKNNGRERIGLTITDNHFNIFPTIYLEEFYHQFLNGISVEDIVSSLLELYHEVKYEHIGQVSILKDFHSVQSKLVPKLINAEKNKTFLQTVPHIHYLDFAIVFYLLFQVDECGTATIPITNSLVDFWKVVPKDLYALALNNAPLLLPASFKPMNVVIKELIGEYAHITQSEETVLFVLTNQLGSFGASCLLYKDILSQIAVQLGENYYILPSSIHEVLIIPESKSPSLEHLNEMILEINETLLDVEEYLSDHAYYFDHKTMMIE